MPRLFIHPQGGLYSMFHSRASVVIWSIGVLCVIELFMTQFIVDYRAESPLGISLGLLAAGLIILSVFVGQAQGQTPAPLTRRAVRARQFHIPVGLLTIAAAFAHWQVLWKNILGLAAMVMLLIVVLSLPWHHARHSRAMHLLHQYAAYALVAISIVHGIDALFLTPN